MTDRDDLLASRCSPQTDALDDEAVEHHLKLTDGWRREDGRIVKTFAFKDYYRTLAFVNALAAIVHAEDHHPDLEVGYNRCTVRFHTHSVDNGRGGLSVNDFICAVKIDALFRQSFA